MKTLILLLTLTVGACNKNNESSPASSRSFQGSQLSESTDILEYVEHETSVPSTASNLDGYPQNTPPAHLNSPHTTDVSPLAATSLTGSIPDESQEENYEVKEAGGIHEGTENVTVTISKIVTGFTQGIVFSCRPLHSYAGLPVNCAEGANLIPRSSLQTGTLKFGIANDQSSQIFEGNSLSTKRWAIKQISNTTGNQSATDDLKGFYAPIGNYLFFLGATSAGGRKIFSIDANDSVDQVTNTRRDQALHDMVDGFFSNKTMTLNGRYLMMMENQSNVKKLATIDANRNINYAANVSGSLTTTDGVWPMDENYNSNVTQILNNEYYVRIAPGNVSKLYKVKSDFTLAQVSNTMPGGGDSVLVGAVFNGNYYFRCSPTVTNQNKLCRTTSDGKVKILSNVKNNLSSGDVPQYLAVTPNYLYVTLEHASGVKKLYRLDSSDNFELISNTSGNMAVTDNFFGGSTTNRVYQVLGHCLYFSANNSNAVIKLFKVCDDGAVKQVLNTTGDNTVSDAYNRSDMPVATDRFYVMAKNSQGGKKLFVVNADGTSQQISNLTGDQTTDDEVGSYIFAFNNEHYFPAKNSAGGRKLHKITQSGKILQVSNITGDQATNDLNLVAFMRVWNNALYFDGLNAQGAAKVFKLYQK